MYVLNFNLFMWQLPEVLGFCYSFSVFKKNKRESLCVVVGNRCQSHVIFPEMSGKGPDWFIAYLQFNIV